MEFLEQYVNQIKMAGEELSKKPMPELTEELFSFYERTGNRTEYEAVYFLRRKYLVTFGMLSLFGEEGAIEKLEDIIGGICREECWALPAHVDRKKKDWRITVELFASETAQALAELISLLGDHLSKDVRETARKEIFRRVLTPFLESQGDYDWWEHSTLNWCAVCNGAIGSTAIYLLQEETVLKSCLERICDSLSYYLSGFSEDGACMEGLGYFTYGMTYFIGFAKQAYDYSKGTIDLLHNDRVERIARFQERCYFSNDSTLSFSDGSSRERFSMGLTSFLASCYDTVHIPSVSLAAEFGDDSCYRWMSCCRDYYWTKEYYDEQKELGKVKKLVAPTVFQDAQWYLCESENGCGIAAKGGDNDEPHNHNDIGSFLYFAGKDLFLPDLGAGEYTRDYFHEKRYQIFCNSSVGHNVPVINGKGQLAGKEHRCKRFEVEKDLVMDLTDAYEKDCVKSMIRKIAFDRKTGELTVEDSFIANANTETFEEGLISYAKPVIENDTFWLSGTEGDCTIIVDGSNLQVSEVDHANHDGSHITVYRMMWEVAIQQGKSRFQIKTQEKAIETRSKEDSCYDTV